MGFLVEGCFQRPHSLSKNNFADHGFSSSGCHIKEGLSADGKLSRPFVSLMKEKSKSDWATRIGWPPQKEQARVHPVSKHKGRRTTRKIERAGGH
jgi:hypothetical protein